MTHPWKRISAERYAEMLDILPPLDWTGTRFMVSEPVSSRDGLSTYGAYAKIGGEFFESCASLTRPEFRAVTDAEILGSMSLTPADIAEFFSDLLNDHISVCDEDAPEGDPDRIPHITPAGPAGDGADVEIVSPTDDGKIILVLKDGAGTFDITIKKRF